jgi:hypothetical protein
VRTLSQELCTRKFAFCLLTKDEKTYFAAGEHHVCLRAHAARSGYNSAKNNICVYCCQRNKFKFPQHVTDAFLLVSNSVDIRDS